MEYTVPRMVGNTCMGANNTYNTNINDVFKEKEKLMKKLLSLIAVLVISLTLSGCVAPADSLTEEEVEVMIEEVNVEIEDLKVVLLDIFEQIDEIYLSEDQINTLIDANIEGLQVEIGDLFVGFAEIVDARIDEIDPAVRTQMERFIMDFFIYAISEGEMTFVELDTVYEETVESYGYGKTYIFEATEPMTLEIVANVDNELELCWYTEGIMGDSYECETLLPTTNTIVVDIPAGFFAFDTESWDMDNNSTLYVVVREVE